MPFAVYTNFEARRSMVHQDNCYQYLNRKSQLLPHNYWHRDLYRTVEEAEAAARAGYTTMHVRRCKVCSP